ncbi:hypothetical protein VTI74DRAFT_5602 [Chaetomium olivicolor]
MPVRRLSEPPNSNSSSVENESKSNNVCPTQQTHPSSKLHRLSLNNVAVHVHRVPSGPSALMLIELHGINTNSEEDVRWVIRIGNGGGSSGPGKLVRDSSRGRGLVEGVVLFGADQLRPGDFVLEAGLGV